MISSIKKYFPLVLLAVFLFLLASIIRTSIFGHVDEEDHIYFEIVFLLLLAVLGELTVVYFKIPSVMILMILGILMSPSFIALTFHFIESLDLPIWMPSEPPEILRADNIIHIFAQLGAIILLFKVGLHNKMEGIFSKDNLIVALCGIVFPFLIGYFYASFSGGNFAYSMFVGAALTATSVGVTVAILREFKLLNERFAEIIIGAAIIDDILGLLVLSFVINMTGETESFVPIIMTFISAAVFIFGSVVAGDYFVRYMDRTKFSQMVFLSVLAFMLLYAYFAEFIKLSAIVGAFMAGVILNRSKHLKEIEEKTYGLELLFMPIFFISLGILVDVNSLAIFAIPILIITVLAMLSKIIPCGIASLFAGLSKRDSLVVGVGMAPRGEVALIVASLGLSTGVLAVSEYSVISAMALITTFLVPPLLGKLLSK
ncbi:MAG: cation:proton antiporter [Candidatus Micrarchaeota archaeon]